MGTHNWGKPLAVIALVFGIIGIVCSVFSIIPLLGIFWAYLALICGGTAVSFGIPGVIGSYGKGKGITGLVLGGVSLLIGILRFSIIASLIA